MFPLSIPVLHISVKIHNTGHLGFVHVTVLIGYLIKRIQSEFLILYFTILYLKEKRCTDVLELLKS